jgi:hypothetical protein
LKRAVLSGAARVTKFRRRNANSLVSQGLTAPKGRLFGAETSLVSGRFNGRETPPTIFDGEIVMAKKPITEFEPISLVQLVPLIECLGCLDSGGSRPDWWIGGMLSNRTIVYGSGRIAREGDLVRHKVDPVELTRCRTLADEALSLGAPGLSSEGDFQWYPFFVAANLDDPAPEQIDEEVVRERFGGTILPIIQILISPIREGSPWWDKNIEGIRSDSDWRADRAGVSLDVWMERSFAGARTLDEKGLDRYETDKAQQKMGDPLLAKIFEIPGSRRLEWSDVKTTLEIRRLQRIIRFFGRPEFRDAAYVEIGDHHHHQRVPRDQWPEGMEGWPTSLPRLLVGLTLGGSLAGLLGYIVQT